MKYNILYVIENLSFGGGERAFAQSINGLDKEKYEIYVTCLPGGIFEERIKTSAKILPLNLRKWSAPLAMFNLTNLYRLKKIIKEKNIQIVHSQGGRADFFARIAARWAKVPAVVSTVAMPVEGYDVNPIKKSIYVLLDRFSERFGHRFIVVSDALRERLIERHKIPSKKVVKIYNGVEIDSDTGCQMPDVRRKIMQEFMISEDTMLVGTIGRLVWQKGLPYFIQAIKEIGARCPKLLRNGAGKMQDVRYLIVGEGEERKNLELKIKNLGLSDRVILTGFRQDIKEILEALDVLVLPSIREGQPIILLEAMAVGKPIVATNIEGVNETVIDGVTGVLVPPKDPFALAEAIVCLLKDSRKAQEMGQAGRGVVEEKFNVDVMVAKTEDIYEQLLNEKNVL